VVGQVHHFWSTRQIGMVLFHFLRFFLYMVLFENMFTIPKVSNFLWFKCYSFKGCSPNVIAWKATCRLELDLTWSFLFVCLGYVVDGMENGNLLLKGVDCKLVSSPWYMDKSIFCLCKMHIVKIGIS
jgi:hypothetical protein